MSEDFGANIITLTDEEGVEHEFEHLDTIEQNDKMYLAFVPAGIPDDSEEPVELVILRAETEGDEEVLVSIDDDAELDAVYNAFMEEAFEEDEDE
ncbi:MAG: DUF1292 domain-containing protein [Clostridia bacterium]